MCKKLVSQSYDILVQLLEFFRYNLRRERLNRIATWHIREETYTKALAEVVNHHHQIEFAGHWGDGSTSSSDGQRFPTGGEVMPGDRSMRVMGPILA